MKAVLSTVAFITALGVGGTMALADPIKERKDIMRSFAKSTGVVVKMIKGEEPYDSAKAAEALKVISSNTDKFVKLYPEGSKQDPSSDLDYFPDGGDIYYAKDTVWEKMEEFKEDAEELEEYAEAAAGTTDKTELAAAAKEIFGECKECHETFRGKR